VVAGRSTLRYNHRQSTNQMTLSAGRSPKGTELFYVAADDKLMAVSVKFSPDKRVSIWGCRLA
jgi:hypothetical protein